MEPLLCWKPVVNIVRKLMLVHSISKLMLATLLSVSRAETGTLGSTKRDSLSSRIKQLTERDGEVSFFMSNGSLFHRSMKLSTLVQFGLVLAVHLNSL